MSRYSELAFDLSSKASADYKALKTAIEADNIQGALSTLIELQRDSNASDSAPTASSSTLSSTSLPADSSGSHAGSAGAQPSTTEGLDARA